MLDKSFKQGWLQAFFDGEGCIHVRHQAKGNHRLIFVITVSNCDKELIDRCSEFLAFFNIEFKRYYKTNFSVAQKSRKPQHFINISKQVALIRFFLHIGFHTNRKQQKLKEASSYILLGKSEREKTHPSKLELKTLYLTKGMSMLEIAKLLKIDENKVHYWLKKHGIPTRIGRDAAKLMWEKRKHDKRNQDGTFSPSSSFLEENSTSTNSVPFPSSNSISL